MATPRADSADAPLDDRAAWLVDRLMARDVAREWKAAAKRELGKPEYAADAPPPLRHVLERLALVGSIKRVVVDLHCEATRAAQAATQRRSREEEAALVPEAMAAAHGCALDVVAQARARWEKITREELLRFASEQGKPLLSSVENAMRVSSPRGDAENAATCSDHQQSETEATATAMAAPPLPVLNAAPARSYKPPPSTRFLYDGNDLLHTLQSIKPLNRAATGAAPWGSIQLQLHSPSTRELRRLFAELAPGHGQIGVDELVAAERQAFLLEKNRVGDLVRAHHSSVSMARQYAKTGCPTSLRAPVWRQALGLPPAISPDALQSFQQLQDQVSRFTYVTDDMYLLDLQRAIDSSDYFVFQDHLHSVVMAFTRDGTVLDRACPVNGAVQLTQPSDLRLLAGDGGDTRRPMNASVPPNGVLPFSGLVLYVAPLTYLYQDDVELYGVFREMYVRYWSRLNAVRGERSTILPLCKLFEDLVLRASPAAAFHLLNAGVQPLDLAFPWIQSAFSGVLEIHQLLLLWDRVVGYDSLELLAVFAAALFHFRASELERVATLDDARALYAELLDVHAIPLLQEYLFLLA